MTLDEAALAWGRAILENRAWSVTNHGRWRRTTKYELGAWMVLYPLSKTASDDCADIDLACVMYAQDVAEGRHR